MADQEIKHRILMVEDDRTIAMGLQYSLEQVDFETVVCSDATQAKTYISSELHCIDCALVDLTLPDGDGYEICRLIKATSDIPVIFLTAVDDEVNVVMGLDMGADDYITKPFRIRELISRIQSVMRRYERQSNSPQQTQQAQAESLLFGPLVIHPTEARVYKDGAEITLTAQEYRLLMYFAKNKGRVLGRNRLLELIWDSGGAYVNDNTLTVTIKRLREKLEDDPRQPQLILTVRGLGYQAGG